MQVRGLLERNRAALEAVRAALNKEGTLSGDQVEEIVRREGHPDDVKAMEEGKREEVLL